MCGLLALAALAFLPQTAAAEAIARCASLPPAVGAQRDAIAAAASSGDLEALAALADPTDFTYSVGDAGDGSEGALAYWQWLEQDEGTDVVALILGLLDAGCAQYDEGSNSFFVWPSAALIDYPDLTADEIDALQTVYDGALESWYVEGFEIGYYIGWRLYIEPDGRWTAFVAGD